MAQFRPSPLKVSSDGDPLLGGLAAAVALVACVLVILDLTDAGLRRW